MSIHRKLMTACAAAVLAFGLAACGSSDDDDTPTAMMPMGTPVAFADLEMGQTVEAGTYAVSDPSAAFLAATEDFELPEGGYAPGAMESVGGLDFTCAADSATNCNVVVNEDGSVTTTGTIQVAMTPPPPTPIESATMAAVTAASRKRQRRPRLRRTRPRRRPMRQQPPRQTAPGSRPGTGLASRVLQPSARLRTRKSPRMLPRQRPKTRRLRRM